MTSFPRPPCLRGRRVPWEQAGAFLRRLYLYLRKGSAKLSRTMPCLFITFKVNFYERSFHIREAPLQKNHMLSVYSRFRYVTVRNASLIFLLTFLTFKPTNGTERGHRVATPCYLVRASSSKIRWSLFFTWVFVFSTHKIKNM